MTTLDVLTRARSAIGGGCRYGLGHGGMDPRTVHPWDKDALCDCSGFAMWALGVSRKHGEIWYDTTRMLDDAKGPKALFAAVEDVPVRAGDLIVYGDHKNQDGAVRQGHVGVVSEVGSDGTPKRAVHCSHGNERRTGDAIGESNVGLWLVAGGIVVRCVLMEQAAA